MVSDAVFDNTAPPIPDLYRTPPPLPTVRGIRLTSGHPGAAPRRLCAWWEILSSAGFRSERARALILHHHLLLVLVQGRAPRATSGTGSAPLAWPMVR